MKPIITLFLIICSIPIFSAVKLSVIISGKGNQDFLKQLEQNISNKEFLTHIKDQKTINAVNQFDRANGFPNQDAIKESQVGKKIEYLVDISPNDKKLRLLYPKEMDVVQTWNHLNSDTIEELLGLLEVEASVRLLKSLEKPKEDRNIFFFSTGVAGAYKSYLTKGEKITFNFAFDSNKNIQQECYLTILSVASVGQILQVFPDPKNITKTGRYENCKTQAIENEPSGFKIIPPYGKERYYFLVSKQKIQLDKKYSIERDVEKNFYYIELLHNKKFKGIQKFVSDVKSNENDYNLEEVIIETREK